MGKKGGERRRWRRRCGGCGGRWKGTVKGKGMVERSEKGGRAKKNGERV